MKKIETVLLVLILALVLTACHSQDKIEGYKSHEILVITLDIEDSIPFEKITLRSSTGEYTDSILQKVSDHSKSYKLKCPHKGEGTFSLCVYTMQDTLCSHDNYVEGGYRPHLRLKNKTFEIVKGF